MKKKKILIIQPHSDDALFSAFHFLVSEKCDVSILTIENNVKRVKEDEKLYEFLGVTYHNLNVQFDDQSFYGFYKKYKDATLENSIEHLAEFFGLDKLEEISNAIKKFLKSASSGVQIVVPWGVGHPFHIFVRDVVEKAVKKPLWYYRDFPHSYKKRALNQVKLQLEDFELLSSIPVAEFNDVKWDLAKKFYKSQSGLLWFEQGYIKKQLPEEVYVRKS